MIDWKILAASFAALLVVSSLLVGDFGVRDFFSGIVEKISELFGSSPFGGMFSMPSAGHAEIDLDLYTGNLTLQPSLPVNITSAGILIEGFEGFITADINEGNALLEQKSVRTRITFRLDQPVVVQGLSIGKLVVSNTRYELSSNQSEIDSENATIELYNFAGNGTIYKTHLNLRGNVSRVMGDSWGIG